MTAWVLDTYYEPGEVTIHRAVVVPGRRPTSLPSWRSSSTITRLYPSPVSRGMCRRNGGEAGISGTPEEMEKGSRDLLEMLRARGFEWRVEQES